MIKHIMAFAVLAFASADFSPPATSYGVPLRAVEALQPQTQHFIYTVPQLEYNIPNVVLPVETSYIYNAPSYKEEVISQRHTTQYVVPSTKYGVPVETYKAPVVAPIRTSFAYQIPAHQEEIPKQPSKEYGAPIETPYPAQKPKIETVYGAPKLAPTPVKFEAPAKPVVNYGVPAPRPVEFVAPVKPILEYGAPPKPVPVYGVPFHGLRNGFYM